MDRRSQAESSKSEIEQAALQVLIEKTVLARAADLAREARYTEAEAVIQATLREHPATPAVLDLLARIHAQQGHWKEAEEAWKLALTHNPAGKTYERELRRIAQVKKWGIFPYLLPPIIVVLLVIFIYGISGRSLLFPFHPTETPSPTTYPTATNSPSPTLTPTVTPTQTPTLTNTVASSPSPALTLVPTPITCNAAGLVNVRSGPGINYPIIGGLIQGDQVEVMGYRDIAGQYRWLLIFKKPDFTGWIYSAYCK